MLWPNVAVHIMWISKKLVSCVAMWYDRTCYNAHDWKLIMFLSCALQYVMIWCNAVDVIKNASVMCTDMLWPNMLQFTWWLRWSFHPVESCETLQAWVSHWCCQESKWISSFSVHWHILLQAARWYLIKLSTPLCSSQFVVHCSRS